MIKGYRKHDECMVCKDTNVKAKELCSKHYAKAMRHDLLCEEKETIIEKINELEKKKQCYICGDIANRTGLCEKHHRICISKGILKRPKEEIISIIQEYENKKICYVCGKVSTARGLCKSCYSKAEYRGLLNCDKGIIKEELKIDIRSKNIIIKLQEMTTK